MRQIISSRALCGGLALVLAAFGGIAQAEIIVVDGDVPQLGESQAGGERAPSLTPEGWNNVVASWLNTKANGNTQAFIGYFNRYGDPQGQPIAMGSASGPTAGKNAASAAPVGLQDESTLVFFSADRKGADAADRRDVFVQLMSNSRTKVGSPKAVNESLGGRQEDVLATRLSNGKVLATWLSHANAAASFDVRGRIVSASGTGITPDRKVTAGTGGAQTLTSVAALNSGKSVLAYFVKKGAKQKALLQRLDADGKRLGRSILLKQTTGSKTYGGAGVGTLAAGRFVAAWFDPVANGKGALKARFFRPDGTVNKTVKVDTIAVTPTSQNAPQVLVTHEGIFIVADGHSPGRYSLFAWLLDDKGKLIAKREIVASKRPVSVTSLTTIPSLDIYFAGFSLSGATPKGNAAFAQDFYVSAGCSVKC